MIRLSLLQFRAQAATTAAALTAFAILLAATGPHLASLYAAVTEHATWPTEHGIWSAGASAVNSGCAGPR
jgi:hypothetical protein